MVQIAVYDASVLYPGTTRDLLIRIAQAGLVQAKWTETILDEVFRALSRRRPDLPSDRLSRTRELMGRAVRDVLVEGFEPLVGGLDLPDPDDRHVLAAAIACRAGLIVTANLRDFPVARLRPWDIAAVTADDLVLALLESEGEHVLTAVDRIAASWTMSRGTAADVLDRLHRDGLFRSVEQLRRLACER